MSKPQLRPKLAELLQLRIELEKRAASLGARAIRNARSQEGTSPPESADDLLTAHEQTLEQLVDVIERIDAANSRLTLPDGRTLARALAERRRLQASFSVLEKVLEDASELGNRYSLREIRDVPAIDIPARRVELDDIARRLRELNAVVQQANWTLEA
jgi:hypothetical protein